MKDFVFISDFDGTLTETDFYRILMDAYFGEECRLLYKDWKNKKIKDTDYLGYVFNNIGRSEFEIDEDILKISLDPFAKQFIHNINTAGGDFVVLSAGTSYYINKVLKNSDIKDIKVYSNEGIYKENGIHFVLDEKSEFYSEVYGIDKELVVRKLKTCYKKVFYAGDSEPDLNPALQADLIFAKGELVQLLIDKKRDYIEFHDFSEIWIKLEKYL